MRCANELVKAYTTSDEGQRRYSPPDVVEAVPEVIFGNPDKDLFLQQHRLDALTGKLLVMDDTASLDRINPTGDYVPGNVQWIHKVLNTAKWDSTQREFVEMCCEVADYSRRRRKAVVVMSAASLGHPV